MRLLTVPMLFLASATALAQGNAGSGIVIVLAQFPGFNEYELGTGAFVDHDGLVVTADHVVHNIVVNPAAASTGTTVTATTPTKLTVYSPYLNKFFDVDPAKPANIVGGQISPTQWLDAALIRVPLTDIERAQIQPLDFSTTTPVQAQKIYAYGPKCNNARTSLAVASGDACLQAGVVEAVLANDPTLSREYQIQAGTTVGYSGGPLVDVTGAIIGVASWGDVLGDTQVVRQLYLPAVFLLNFLLPQVPSSPNWGGASACSFAGDIHTLTIVDWTELSRRWSSASSQLNSDQCSCCCQSLDKLRNPYLPSPLTLKCAPPFCTEKRLYGLANAVNVANASGATGPKTDALISAIQTIYKPTDLASLSRDARKDLLSTLGQAVGNLSISLTRQKSMDSLQVESLALNLLEDSQKVRETSSDYVVMSGVFAAQDDQTNKTAAEILSATTGSDPATLKHELHVDPKQLKSSITKAVHDVDVQASTPSSTAAPF
jgi:hypothetical protein